jgi:cytochrome P450
MSVLKTELIRGPSPVIIQPVATSSTSKAYEEELKMNRQYMARGYPPGPTRSKAKSLALRDMDTYVKLHQEYGDIFMLPLGAIPLVVTRSPEHIKSILGGEAMKLFPRPKHALDSIRLLFGRAQIALDGPDHSANKRMLSRWLFSEEKNAEMSTHLSEVCQELVEKISEQAKPDVEVFRLAELASVDLNGVISLGKSYNALTRGRSPVRFSLSLSLSLVRTYHQHIYTQQQELEALKRADEIFLSRAMNKKWRETETKKTTETFESAKRLLLKTFGDAENAVRDGSRDTPSALRHMIEENARTRNKMTCPMGRNPTPLELKSNLVGFLAGVGNSARLVAVVIEMFSRHKQMQERFLVELHQVFGECSQEEAQERAIRGEGVNIDRFDYDRLMRLEYLKCFIHECLRMYPPSVSVAPRSCSSDNPLGKYTIPSGTSCVCVCVCVHSL